MLKNTIAGFKDFIMRGNVVELAVAVVIGTAFTALVKSFTDSIIQPLINSIGGTDVTGLGFHIINDNPNTYVDFAAVITNVVNFLIVAVVVYFIVVLPLNTLMERRRRGEEPGPAAPTDVELLTEIRDLLAAQRNGGAAATGRHTDG